MENKKNILIKLSGASLKDDSNIISTKKLNDFAKQIKLLLPKYGIGIVLGGGNIWRGIGAKDIGMNRAQADNMGMMATIINSIALKSSLENMNISSEIYSALHVPRITNNHNANSFNKEIKKGKVIIFAGGTGMPYFSTDTCSALRALEISSDIILMGKNGTDGLYDKDPNKHSDAEFIKSITYREVIDQNLRIADLTFITMCQDNNIDTLIFDIDKNNSIINVLNREGKFTIVKNER